MASIYIHIPYCKKACYYCNFHFSTTLHSMSEMILSICKEIQLRSTYLPKNEIIESIYFGGGTPSLLNDEQLSEILQTVRNQYNIAENAEVTLEANPDDIQKNKLAFWKSIGINRFSLGVQSFQNEDLVWMNRAHNSQQSLQSIKDIQEAGFENITIDLIYGTPTLSDENWEKNIETAIQLNIPHLSCYALTVEEGTALDKMIAQHKKENTDPDKQARHFEYLMQRLKTAGFDHYEVSNFGKPGFHSRHNSAYWQGKKYIGIGPSAHSFNGNSRQWNIANNAKYIQTLSNNEIPFEIENLTPHQQLEEYIMTSLRTMEGLNLQLITENWGENSVQRIEKLAKKFLDNELMIKQNGYLILTDKGFLLADGIAADFF
ncbi:radical SAM family heme chaperone HemW [Rhizosphaericola mali]|uniref:Heme chaperone HemW n=1 Tax=Rhizosphaericola mali TaxID=2545455 RepID=A0A5P2G233_9BACT|nr:radical SAM family heme chaperone HemW [Rhizosphaericola mali]QES89525.1 radical SAM family heme chaperone HemW [Rhizosphaericola mali]